MLHRFHILLQLLLTFTCCCTHSIHGCIHSYIPLQICLSPYKSTCFRKFNAHSMCVHQCMYACMYACMYVCASMCVCMRAYPRAKTQIRLQESHLCSAGGPTALCSYPSSPLKYCRRPGEFCSSMGFPWLSTRLGTPLSLYPNTCAHVCCSVLQ